MKKAFVVCLSVVILALTAMAQKEPQGVKLSLVSIKIVSRSPSVNPVLFSCTCSCAKDCDGWCTGHYSTQECNSNEGVGCIATCCDNAAPDCRGPGGILGLTDGSDQSVKQAQTYSPHRLFPRLYVAE
jgi:hypothetical protein